MIDRDAVYLVESEEDRTALLALYTSLGERAVEWFDTVRDRGFRVKSVDREGEAVRVRTPAATYRFVPLTLELYRAKVRERVAGRPDFSSTEALIRYYRSVPA